MATTRRSPKAAPVPTPARSSTAEPWPPPSKAEFAEVRRPVRPINLDKDNVAMARRKIAEARGIKTVSVKLLVGSNVVLEDDMKLAEVSSREIQVLVQVPEEEKAVKRVALELPMDEEDLVRIQEKYPSFKGTVPSQAMFWSQRELELYLSTDGRLVPSGPVRSGSNACEMLRRLRFSLAEQGITRAASCYSALARRMGAVSMPELSKLPHLDAAATEIPRMDSAPSRPESPLILRSGVFRAVSDWNLEFWQLAHGRWEWTCRATSPQFPGDSSSGPDGLELQASIGEYIDYALVLMEEDPHCVESDAVGYFRLTMDRIPLFSHSMRDAYDRAWRDYYQAEGLEDCTARWAQMLGDRLQINWLDFSADYFKVSLAAPGAVERLHKEPNHAHTWLSMADGRRLVFLFPPSDSEKLYEKVADHSGALPDNFVQSVSPVDIFTPNSKRHQKFSQATGHAAVLEKGETLIIPADWWWYTAALSPSVAILHSFYNRTNRLHAAKDFGDRLARVSDPPGELPRDFREQLAELHEDIELDEED